MPLQRDADRYPVGPFLGGFLTHYLGWRTIFLVNLFLGFIIIVSIFWKSRGEWHEASEERFGGMWFILPGGLAIFAFAKREMKVKILFWR